MSDVSNAIKIRKFKECLIEIYSLELGSVALSASESKKYTIHS